MEKYPPRISSMMKTFEEISTGSKQSPKLLVQPNADFFELDLEYRYYYDIYNLNLGVFNHHAIASMPYVAEECMRLGIALSRFSQTMGYSVNNPLKFYGTSSGDGTHSRTLAEYARGRIITLTDSPNKGNLEQFERLLNHKWSSFYLGPYTNITTNFLRTYKEGIFNTGFDVIWENTTFQMYGADRVSQIEDLKKVLKKDGLMIFLEKLGDGTSDEYLKMEKLKNSKFKSKYFDKNELDQKETSVLSIMMKMQVDYDGFTSAVKKNFAHLYMVWNSTNFYEFIACDCESKLHNFVSLLPKPYVPQDFVARHPLVKQIF